MKRAWKAAGLALLAVVLATGARAQAYRFEVPEMTLDVQVLEDGSARITYDILFRNQPGAHAIDVVDVGLPHPRYAISNMKAWIDDKPLSGIKRSTYISVGVEVPLGPNAIPAGSSGLFSFQCVMPDMVWQDTTNEDLASVQVTPTWFDPSLVVGTTDLTVIVHCQAGVSPDEILWQDDRWPFTDKGVDEGPARGKVKWELRGHHLGPNNPKLGISFPKRGITHVQSLTPWELAVKWISERKAVQRWSAVLLGLLFTFSWFRFTGGTGCVPYVLVLVGAGIGLALNPGAHFIYWPVLIALSVWAWKADRKRRRYIPAKVTVEGGGIKRGLTAPEAAVLLELPAGKLATLVLFGLLKKGVLTQRQADPLWLDVAEAHVGDRERRLRAASREGVVLHGYEHAFLNVLQKESQPVAKHDLTWPVKGLIEVAGKRMAGFDYHETRQYYERIVARAWKMAEGVHTEASFANTVNGQLEWLLMDDDWGGRFGGLGPVARTYRPSWIGIPVPGGSPSIPAPAPSGGPGGTTSLGEVAASFVGWAENAANGIVGTIEPGAVELTAPDGGLVSFASLDKATGEFVKSLASSGGGGGGGWSGGGCACACAGCACACACAGGGR